MKRTTAIAMYQAVLGIKLNKMSDDMTEAIISNTLALADVNNSFQNAQTTARKLTVETIDKDRLTAYDELTTKMRKWNLNRLTERSSARLAETQNRTSLRQPCRFSLLSSTDMSSLRTMWTTLRSRLYLMNN